MEISFKKIFLFGICLTGFLQPYAQSVKTQPGQEEVLDIVRLFRQAGTCMEATFDSCMKDALRQSMALLWQPERHQARMIVYQQFLELGNALSAATYQEAVHNMLSEAERCQEDLCLAKAHILMAQGYLKEGNTFEAQRESSLAVIHADRSGILDLEIESELAHAEVLVRSKNKNARVDALDILLQAKLKAYEHDNTAALSKCYEALFNFYANIGAFDSSAAYKERQIHVSIQREHPDSDRIQQLRIELAEPLLKGNSSPQGSQILDEVITYGLRHNQAGIVNEAMQYFRNYYLERNDLVAVAKLYRRFPQALSMISDSIELLRVKAYLFDAGNKKDSALFYYQSALQGLQAKGSNFQYSYLQLFHGRALRHWGKLPEAVAAFKMGQEAAEGYQPFLIQFLAELDTTYQAMNQYDSAYFFNIRYAAMSKSWDSSVNGEALLRQQIAAQEQEQIIAERKAEHLREQRHFIQYLSITLGIVVLFLVFCLMSSLSVPKWAITTTGFFAFVVLFEFIIMVTDEFFAEKVHGEPAYLLLCKIALILLLSPLHHKLEEKLLHYFHEHRLINNMSIWEWSVWKDFKKKFSPEIKPKKSSLKPRAITPGTRRSSKKPESPDTA